LVCSSAVQCASLNLSVFAMACRAGMLLLALFLAALHASASPADGQEKAAASIEQTLLNRGRALPTEGGEQGEGSPSTVSAQGATQGLPKAGAVLHGARVHIQSMYPGGRWLDTRGGPCNGNPLCVSAASTPVRDSGSGTWTVLRKSGAGALAHGDEVFLQNNYAGNMYLDASGGPCNGNPLCVSAATGSDRDHGSGTWKVLRARGPGPVMYGDNVHLQNQWGAGYYLDVRGGPCNGNPLCVSAATGYDRDSGSGTWQFV